MENTSIAARMKGYESVYKQFLTRRTPVIVRLDGRAFHSYTKKMPKPFFEDFRALMWDSTKILAEEVDSCVFAYTQSDEVSLLLKDWTMFKTQAWFENNLSKIVSNTASIFTAVFNDLAPNYLGSIDRPKYGFFDSRAFTLPESEVVNYFIWRQQDAVRNSINSLGQAHFSQKKLNGLNTDQVQELLFTELGINWNDEPTWARRGVAVRLNVDESNIENVKAGGAIDGPRLILDKEIPIFTKDREYINRLMFQVQE